MRMFTKGIHYKMGECLYYKANVIIAEHKSYKQKLTYATKKIQSTFTVGLLWSPSGGFPISGLGIYCIVYRECPSFCCPRDSHLLGQFILYAPHHSNRVRLWGTLSPALSHHTFYLLPCIYCNLRITDLLINWCFFSSTPC